MTLVKFSTFNQKILITNNCIGVVKKIRVATSSHVDLVAGGSARMKATAERGGQRAACAARIQLAHLAMRTRPTHGAALDAARSAGVRDGRPAARPADEVFLGVGIFRSVRRLERL